MNILNKKLVYLFQDETEPIVQVSDTTMYDAYSTACIQINTTTVLCFSLGSFTVCTNHISVRLPRLIRADTFAITKTITFSFPASFSSVPKFVASPRNQAGTDYADAFIVSVRSISPAQVTFNIIRIDSTLGWDQLLQIDWMAWE